MPPHPRHPHAIAIAAHVIGRRTGASPRKVAEEAHRLGKLEDLHGIAQYLETGGFHPDKEQPRRLPPTRVTVNPKTGAPAAEVGGRVPTPGVTPTSNGGTELGSVPQVSAPPPAAPVHHRSFVADIINGLDDLTAPILQPGHSVAHTARAALNLGVEPRNGEPAATANRKTAQPVIPKEVGIALGRIIAGAQVPKIAAPKAPVAPLPDVKAPKAQAPAPPKTPLQPEAKSLTVAQARRILEQQGAAPGVAARIASEPQARARLLQATNAGFGVKRPKGGNAVDQPASTAVISSNPKHKQHVEQLVRAYKHLKNSGGAGAQKVVAALSAEYGVDEPGKVEALRRAGEKYGVAPALLAAIGRQESTNGTSTLPGVHSGQNFAGAAGPFQIGNGTGAAGDWWHEHMPPGANIYDYATAAEGAAKYLSEAGATTDPSTWYNAALSYNHDSTYASEVTANAEAADQVNWNHADPKSKAALAAVESRLERNGLDPATIGNTENRANYIKVFGQQVGRELALVKRGEYDKGKGTLVLDSGVSIDHGHELEIAARLKLLSAKIGKPVYIISGYRSPQHSVEVGGFADDPHTEGEAADIGIGSPTLESAGTIPESVYESVGLHRPFYPESAHEVNHVQLLDNGTPSFGSGAEGGAPIGASAVGGSVTTGGSIGGAPASGGTGAGSRPAVGEGHPVAIGEVPIAEILNPEHQILTPEEEGAIQRIINARRAR